MYTMRWWLTGSLIWLAAGCASGPQTPLTTFHPPAPSSGSPAQAAVNLGVAWQHGLIQESALAIYTLDINPVTLTATSRLKEVRQGQANDDLYLLSINNFLRPDSLRIRGLVRMGSTLELSYQIAHPFPAPDNVTGAPNGFSNRSDLGIAGMVLFLADVPSATGNTYFTDRVANTALVTNADGYYSPEDMLSFSGNANTFPYRQLVDETLDPRIGVSNGSDPTGNFGTDGWTRAKYGPNNDGWTGYGVLHQGQTAANTVGFDLAALSGGLSLDVAIIAKYNDPRGGQTAAQKRANRLPGATADHTRFAYRMPHGALDIASIRFLGDHGPGFSATGVSGTELEFHVVDWDANATPSTENPGELQNDPVVTNVELAEIGSPDFTVCIPGVIGDATVTAAISEDAGSGEGIPGDPLIYRGTVSKTIDTAPGTFTGMARAIDPEDGTPLVTPLDEGTPPLPLSGSAALPRPVTYQAFPVTVINPNAAPAASYLITTPLVPNGGTVSLNILGLADPEGDPVDILVDWDDDGTYTFAFTANSPYPATIPLSSPITYTHNPPAPDTRDLPVRLTDSFNNVDLLPVQTFDVAPPSSGIGWVYAPATQSTSTEHAYHLRVDATGNVYLFGVFATGCDFGGGPRVTLSALDNFLVKLSPTGAYQWDRTHGTAAGFETHLGLDVDDAGNVYCAGSWRDTINFGGGPRTNNQAAGSTNYDTYVVKYDTNGNYLWDAVTSGDGSCGWGSLQDHHGLAVHGPTGDAVITTLFNRSEQLGAISIVNALGPTATSNDPLVAKLSSAGTWVWATNFIPSAVSTGTEYGRAVDFTASGDVIASGLYANGMDFGSGVPSAADTSGNGYIVRLTGSTGAYVWHYTFGSATATTAEFATGLAVDATRVYAAGRFVDNTNFGGGPRLTGSTLLDGFALALDLTTGAYLWDTVFTGNTSTDAARGIAVSGPDVYVTGDFLTGVNFGGGARSSNGGTDVYLVKLNAATGAYIYDRQIGGTGADVGRDIAVTGGNPVIGGSYLNTVDFDPGPGTALRTAVGGISDLFAVKLDGLTGEF